MRVSDHCAGMKPIYLHLGGALALSFTIAAATASAVAMISQVAGIAVLWLSGAGGRL